MNATTITKADVLAEPFRWSRHITVEDEIAIGKDMEKRREIERQRAKDLPINRDWGSIAEKGPDGEIYQDRSVRRAKAIARRSVVLDAIGDDKLTVQMLLPRLPEEHQCTLNALAQLMTMMQAEGLVDRDLQKLGTRRANYWSRRSGGRT